MDAESGTSIISDHAFEPEGEWWTRCRHCHLAEAAHTESKLQEEIEAKAKEIGERYVFQATPSTNGSLTPQWTGEICMQCGAEMIRTGTCHTCPHCGYNDGCG